jgi:hypothetical protein
MTESEAIHQCEGGGREFVGVKDPNLRGCPSCRSCWDLDMVHNVFNNRVPPHAVGSTRKRDVGPAQP